MGRSAASPSAAPRAPSGDAPDARRAAVLRAVVAEALDAGSIEAVGMRAVCERAGCSAPVVYRLFGDRSGLVRAAVRFTHQRLVDEIERAAARPDPTETRLRAIAVPFLRRTPGDAEVFESLVAAECRSDAVLAGEVRAVFGRFARLIEGILRDGQSRGDVRAGADPTFVAWRFVELGLFRSQMRLMRLSEPERIDYLNRAFEALLAELRPRRPAPERVARRSRKEA